MDIAIGLVVGIILGLVAWRLLGRGGDDTEAARLRAELDTAVEKARAEAEAAARAQFDRLSDEAEAEQAARRKEIAEREERLRKREEAIERRDETLDKREGTLTRREKEAGKRERRLERQEETLEGAISEHRERLEAVAGLSQQEARALLMDEVRDEARQRSIDQVRVIEQEARELADERARLVVAAAIQRYASEHVADRTALMQALVGLGVASDEASELVSEHERGSSTLISFARTHATPRARRGGARARS